MKEESIIVIRAEELRKIIREELHADKSRAKPDFASEKLSRTQAEKLAGVSAPTFRKMINAGLFPEHGYGKKIFFLKSEVIEGLKKNANK